MTTIDVGKGNIDNVWRYLTGPSHTAGMNRNLMIFNSANPADPFNSIDGFPYLVREAKRSASGALKNDVYTIRQSFDESELNYNSSIDVQIANELGRDLAEAFLKKRGIQRYYAVFTQADGQTHHLHNHIIIINPDYLGRAISKGISFHEVADLNDQVVISGLHANGRNTAIQKKLQVKKQEEDDRSVANATGTSKYGHYHSDDGAKKNRDYMTNVLRHALSSATSRVEFNRYLIRQGIQINRQSNDNAGGWLRKDGRLRDSLSLVYDHTHLKTKTALSLTLEQIDEKLANNARVPLNGGSGSPHTESPGKNTVSRSDASEKLAKASTHTQANDADTGSKSAVTVTDWESPAQVRARIHELMDAQEQLLYKRVRLQRLNRIAEANQVNRQMERMGMEITMLQGQLADIKSKSMVRSTEIERAKLNKQYRAPES